MLRSRSRKFGKVGIGSRSGKFWKAGVGVGNFGKVGSESDILPPTPQAWLTSERSVCDSEEKYAQTKSILKTTRNCKCAAEKRPLSKFLHPIKTFKKLQPGLLVVRECCRRKCLSSTLRFCEILCNNLNITIFLLARTSKWERDLFKISVAPNVLDPMACGFTWKAAEKPQTFYSPNYMRNYTEQRECHWLIAARDPTRQVQLNIHETGRRRCCNNLKVRFTLQIVNCKELCHAVYAYVGLIFVFLLDVHDVFATSYVKWPASLGKHLDMTENLNILQWVILQTKTLVISTLLWKFASLAQKLLVCKGLGLREVTVSTKPFVGGGTHYNNRLCQQKLLVSR